GRGLTASGSTIFDLPRDQAILQASAACLRRDHFDALCTIFLAVSDTGLHRDGGIDLGRNRSNHVASTAAGATIPWPVTSKFLDWLSAFVGGFVLADSPRDGLVTPAGAAIGSGQASYCASWATHASTSSSARVMSASRPSVSSSPIDRRIMESVIPRRARSCGSKIGRAHV